MDKIKDLKRVINNSIKKLNKKYIKRKCKINIEDIIYGLSLKTLNSYTFDKVVYELNKKREDIISPSGFKFKNKYIKSNDIQILNNELLNHIYKNKYEKRTLAVDGSYLKTLKSLNKNGLKFSSKLENYTYSIIGGLYDVDKKIIINYNHSIEMNERKSFKEQSKYIRKGDTLLFDRGYYCEDLVNFLNNKKIDYIFRIKSDSKKINFLKNNNVKEYIYTIQNIKYKIINYNIDPNGEEYYLITSLIDKNINELKELYKKRWSIETHFKEAKYTTSLKEINSTTIENLLKEINMHNYVYILYYFFNDCIKEKYIGNTCELNHKISLEKFIQDILFILIYKKNIDKELLKIIKILPRTYKHSKKDRHFQRISKRNITRWYLNKEKSNINIDKEKLSIIIL